MSPSTTNAHASSSTATLAHVPDPHQLPSFTTPSVVQPKSTVLYLPPLLSSLPRTHSESDSGYESDSPSLEALSADKKVLLTSTRLPDIDPASLSLHRALHNFHPIVESYSATPYHEAFNWDELELPEEDEREWYCVAFRSKRKAGSENDALYEADHLAHQEAVANGGLIMYWYGVPDPQTGMNLATCIWQSRAHAVAANSRPHHARAAKLAAASYEVYALERYVLKKEKDERGVTVETYSGGNAGW